MCKLAAEDEVTTKQQEDDSGATGVPASSAVPTSGSGLPNEPTQHPTDAVPPELTLTAADPQIGLVESPSSAYVRAVIPNLDSMIAENDLSSLDAKKR